MNKQPDKKHCARCGREIVWRKRWEAVWQSVRYCSDACRRHGLRSLDHELEQAIIGLLQERPRGATACPSEIAQAAAAARGWDDWRRLMEPVRCAARRLVNAGQIEILQGGRSVNPSTARGPTRLRLCPRASGD